MNDGQREEAFTREILEATESRVDVTPHYLARRMGVAPGLANSYLEHCVRKGLVNMQQAPPSRYLYYLTPKVFAEKSRLIAGHLSSCLYVVTSIFGFDPGPAAAGRPTR